MSLWQRIKDAVGRLFNKNIEIPPEEAEDRAADEEQYEGEAGYNLAAIIANAVAEKVVVESEINVYEQSKDGRKENKRTALLNNAAAALWFNIDKIVARMCGTGGVAIVPYVEDGELYYGIVPQGCLTINKMRGDDITDATLLADTVEKDNHKYYRFIDYTVKNNVLTIENRAIRDISTPVSLSEVEEWAEFSECISLSNVNRVLFSYFKSPVDNRKAKNLYGVPLTFGCDDIINDIEKTLKQIDKEFELKRALVGIDERMLDSDERLPGSGLFKKFKTAGSGTESLWELFDPAIRDSSFYNKLQNQLAFLEKAVGTSRGILTDKVTTGATATEIKASNMETFALVEKVRKAVEKGVKDFLYACDVLAEHMRITPPGDYSFAIEWDYTLIESSTETFQQLMQGYSIGAIKLVEIRQQLRGRESREDADRIVD